MSQKSKIAKIDIPLSLEINPFNDCGPLCLQMIFLKDKNLNEDELSLEHLRERVGKTFEEGTNPGDMCRVLQEEDYIVNYFSTIDIKSIADNDPKTNFENWDQRIKYAVMISKSSPLIINTEKLYNSAKWIMEEKNKNIIVRKNLSIKEMISLLKDNKRIITLVKNSSHYVVIVEIDETNIYFNDPESKENPVKKTKTHEEFLKYWAEEESIRDAIVAIPKVIKI